MLTPEAFADWCARNHIPHTTQMRIAQIRLAPPTRRVQSRVGNVSVRYPSRKMGVIIQAESHHNELAALYQLEHDLTVLEYYDQPPSIKLTYAAKSGKVVGVLHTSDLFVLRQTEAGWEECKTEEELLHLAETQPHRYVLDSDGQWRCPPGEAVAAPLGLYYRVRSSKGINWIFQRNMTFLEDYYRAPDVAAQVAPPARAAIESLVTARPGLALAELLTGCAPATADDIYALLLAEQLYIDLDRFVLAEPERVPVFRDGTTARAYELVTTAPAIAARTPTSVVELVAGAAILWDGCPWTLANIGDTETTLLGADGALLLLPTTALSDLAGHGKLRSSAAATPTGLHPAIREHLLQASPANLAEANRRYEIIAPLLRGTTDAAAAPTTRTQRQWRAQYRAAEAEYGCGYIGLLPKWRQSGNYVPRLDPKVVELMDEYIRTKFETPTRRKMRSVWGQLAAACQERGLDPPSYMTFTKVVRQRPQHEQITKREGKRAAYPQEPFYWELELTTPRQGDRPWEIAHLDHTELDIELLDSQTGRPLGRPWATFLSDAYSRRLLAVVLIFDPPSYRSCMLAVRECVRRLGRLPQILVVDGGSDFQSVYFETLLARYEVTKKQRPGAKPRFGSVVERLFGTANTEFVYNLLGNTQPTREPRQMTAAVDPKRHANWTLPRLYVRLREWAYEVYDTRDHPALGQSPREAFTSGVLQAGNRHQRLIPYDEDFRRDTLPSPDKGTAKVQPNKGVKINYRYYWADAFRHSEVENTQVPVRYDPYDAGMAYAYVRKQWVRCISEYYPIFAGHTERELALATAELHQRDRQSGRAVAVSAAKLAAFITSLEAEEVLSAQWARDTEARVVWNLIDGATVSATGPLPDSGIGGGNAPPTTSLANSPAPSGESPLPHLTRVPRPAGSQAPAPAPRHKPVIFEDF